MKIEMEVKAFCEVEVQGAKKENGEIVYLG